MAAPSGRRKIRVTVTLDKSAGTTDSPRKKIVITDMQHVNDPQRRQVNRPVFQPVSGHRLDEYLTGIQFQKPAAQPASCSFADDDEDHYYDETYYTPPVDGINERGDGTESPVLVNPKQYERIMKRRAARAKLEADGRIPRVRAKYMHESRHKHALSRPRGADGKYLNEGRPKRVPKKKLLHNRKHIGF